MRNTKVLTFVALIAAVAAQVQHYATPYSFSHASSLAPLKVSVFPTVDVAQLIEEDAKTPKDVPLRFGLPMNPKDLNITIDGIWENMVSASGSVWRLRVALPGAVSVGVTFDQFHIPHGGMLFAYNEDGQHMAGAFTHRNNKPDSQFQIRYKCYLIHFSCHHSVASLFLL